MTEQPEPAKADKPIVFYCKDCEEVVETHRIGKKYVYKCKKCGTKNVAFGSQKSIYGFFRLDEKEKEKAAIENEKKVKAKRDSGKQAPAKDESKK